MKKAHFHMRFFLVMPTDGTQVTFFVTSHTNIFCYDFLKTLQRLPLQIRQVCREPLKTGASQAPEHCRQHPSSMILDIYRKVGMTVANV